MTESLVDSNKCRTCSIFEVEIRLIEVNPIQIV